MMRYFKSDLLLLTAYLIWGLAAFLSNSLLSLHHAVLALALIATLIEKPQLRWQKSTLCLGLLIALLILSVLFNWGSLISPLGKILKTKYFFFGAVGALLISYQRERLKSSLPRILLCFLASFLLTVVYGLAKYLKLYFSDGSLNYRPTGFFGMIMSYAYTAVWPVLLIVYLAINPQLKIGHTSSYTAFVDRPWFRYLISALSLLTLYLAQARGALVGFLIALPLLFLWKSRRSFVIVSAVVVLLLSLAVWDVVHTPKTDDPQSTKPLILQSKDSESNRMRLSQYEMAWRAFRENALIGQGWRGLEEKSTTLKAKWKLAYPNFAGHAHSNFLEVLGASGVFAFLVFLGWLFLWGLEIFFRADQEWRPYLLAGLTAFLVSGLFQSTVIDSEYAFTLFAFYALTPLFSLPRRGY